MDSSNEATTPTKPVEVVQRALTWAYDAALDGVPGLGTLDEFVSSYCYDGRNPEDAIESLIKWQMAKAGTTGFVSGLGGLVTLPIAVPANLAGVLLIQLRMITAIAKIRGYNIHSDQVRTLCIACLAGSAMSDILKEVGIKMGTKLTQQAIMKITGVTLVRINQAVGFRLITKAGSTGILNLTKMVPFVGGIVGGSFDVATTGTIARTAKSAFTPRPLPPPEGEPSVIMPSCSEESDHELS